MYLSAYTLFYFIFAYDEYWIHDRCTKFYLQSLYIYKRLYVQHVHVQRFNMQMQIQCWTLRLLWACVFSLSYWLFTMFTGVYGVHSAQCSYRYLGIMYIDSIDLCVNWDRCYRQRSKLKWRRVVLCKINWNCSRLLHGVPATSFKYGDSFNTIFTYGGLRIECIERREQTYFIYYITYYVFYVLTIAYVSGMCANIGVRFVASVVLYSVYIYILALECVNKMLTFLLLSTLWWHRLFYQIRFWIRKSRLEWEST